MRPIVAISATAHYLATMLFPVFQPIVYPRWTTIPGAEGFSDFLLRSGLSFVVLSAGAYAVWRFRSGPPVSVDSTSKARSRRLPPR